MISKIDLHSHFIPEGYKHALLKHLGDKPDGWSTPNWNINETLNFMRDVHITKSIFELSSPHINFGDKEETISLAKEANDLGESLRNEHDEIEYLITLPLPYEKESIIELNRNYKDYKPLGVSAPTNSRGHYWGDPEFDNLYIELNSKKAVVVLHPNKPSESPLNAAIDIPVPLYGFLHDSTLTILNMMRNGFFDKYPDIKIVVPHAGAFLSVVADRWELFKNKFDSRYPISSDAYAVMSKLYFDLAGAPLPRQLGALLSIADENHLLYGSDTPYTDLEVAKKLTQELEQSDLLTDTKKNKVFSINAQKLFNLM